MHFLDWILDFTRERGETRSLPPDLFYTFVLSYIFLHLASIFGGLCTAREVYRTIEATSQVIDLARGPVLNFGFVFKVVRYLNLVKLMCFFKLQLPVLYSNLVNFLSCCCCCSLVCRLMENYWQLGIVCLRHLWGVLMD